MTDPSPGGARSQAPALARGVARLLSDLGYASVPELVLGNGRRVDVMGLGRGGELLTVEIKMSVQDFRADSKWQEYLDYCERFYFAVPQDFPRELLPRESGLMVADPYGALILREAPARPLNAARRKAVTLLFAQTAARRLSLLLDPPL